MPTQNVGLSEQQARFVRRTVSGGGFRNASEAVRAGLRLLEQQQRLEQLKLQSLRNLGTQAFEQIDRGGFELVESADIDRFMDAVASRASKKR